MILHKKFPTLVAQDTVCESPFEDHIIILRICVTTSINVLHSFYSCCIIAFLAKKFVKTEGNFFSPFVIKYRLT